MNARPILFASALCAASWALPCAAQSCALAAPCGEPSYGLSGADRGAPTWGATGALRPEVLSPAYVPYFSSGPDLRVAPAPFAAGPWLPEPSRIDPLPVPSVLRLGPLDWDEIGNPFGALDGLGLPWPEPSR